ncbi:hypothetical protein [Microbacterium sediminis]|nr:hypothetical protein [Microbacterium sediminis]
MSTPLPHIRPAEVRERVACMCATGGACSSYAPGHALHLIQARIASATPAEWVDGIVEAADPLAGTLVVRSLDGDVLELWNGSGAALEAPAGTPVAVHRRYSVLAAGRARFNVAAA